MKGRGRDGGRSREDVDDSRDEVKREGVDEMKKSRGDEDKPEGQGDQDEMKGEGDETGDEDETEDSDVFGPLER